MIEKCQVFTPSQNVIELLDAAGYISGLYGKKVIENACGDGNILTQIVSRYIQDSLNNNKNLNEIKQGLEIDIHGAEIDEQHHLKCLKNLDKIASSFGIRDVAWNISNTDFLKQNFEGEFDFVIGNPPYINYRELTVETRSFLKKNFISCRNGKFDYFYAFVEASNKSINSTGKFAYLIPNSLFKNVFAQELRNIILPHLVKIIDYTSHKLFSNALTSSAIIVCDKEISSKKLEYVDIEKNTTTIIEKDTLDKKWIFNNYIVDSKPKKRFGDYFSAAISVATLLNKAYTLKDFKKEKDYVVVNDFKIENGLIREGVSPRSLNYKKSELIIFPYRYINGKLVRYSSEEFNASFPEATKYLGMFSDELSNRNSDKNTEWFEYGRSQALAHLNQPKLLVSTVITKEVKVYELTKESVPYSGIYIVPRKELTLAKAKEILESDVFYKYVQAIGINANGNSLRITAVDINNFQF
ncbi:Eco57I restriction-modification methylase domain-containing protein [Paenibacillus xylanexedens]|uniref:Eco57I restriction-modification methylase domain-containing protein n=1 Tax=Paenibacillus xylanexedens TaxID=528191 RepID=UPI003D01A6B5